MSDGNEEVLGGGPPATTTVEPALLRRLLELQHAEEVETLLREALDLVLTMSGAEHGYIEVQRPHEDAVVWSHAAALSKTDVDTVRTFVSRGIVTEALAHGETVQLLSAQLDPRFNRRSSVREAGIEAVICAPIGQPAVGVVYLQRRGRGPFSQRAVDAVTLFARHTGPAIERLFADRARSAVDRTQRVRARILADSFIGQSEVAARLLEQVANVAPLDVGVLLTGPSGGGKNVIARMIAANSTRVGKPFVEVNCAALPDGLIESELFGAHAGAHSTATRRIIGKFEVADGGILFLDEVAELSPATQGSLLTALESGRFHPLGASHPVKVNVRVIAATNKDLRALTEAGRFRDDLYYRIALYPIDVPGLDARRDDIPLLLRAFVAAAAKRHRFTTPAISPGAMIAALVAEWRGNIRELKHVAEQAVIEANAERSPIEARHLARGARRTEPEPASATGLSYSEATRAFQAQLIATALLETDWNVAEASRRLGITRSHVYNLIREFGLRRGQGA